MDIAYCTDDGGVEMMLVSIFSVAKNHDSSKFNINVHVLESGLSPENRAKINLLNETFEHLEIECIAVDKSLFGRFYRTRSLPAQAYYRYLLPQLLPEVERILYIDIDILCRAELASLFDLDMGDNYIAAVPDYSVENQLGKFKGYKDGIGMAESEPYFNSGILLMNLEKMRDGIIDTFLHNAGKNRAKIIPKEFDLFVDQTVANLTFVRRVMRLPDTYNTLLHDYERRGEGLRVKSPVMLHFSGEHKPFSYLRASDPVILGYINEYTDYYVGCMGLVNPAGTYEQNNHILRAQFDHMTKKVDSLRGELKKLERALAASNAYSFSSVAKSVLRKVWRRLR